MNNVRIINQLAVLDNETKLRILSLLADTGAKSITDISKILNLNFSTAHKYLEQLERTGFVKSKQETENRLKRMFYIQDFNITVNPRTVSSILHDNNIKKNKTSSFNVITNNGLSEPFNKDKFLKEYINIGLPINTVDLVLESIKDQIYNNITITELRELFLNMLKERLKSINNVIIKSQSNVHDNYFQYIRSKNPDIIKLHFDGDIFISNITGKKLMNFSHDIYAIKELGLDKKPENIPALLNQLVTISKRIPVINNHAYGSFNYFLALLGKDLSDDEIVRHVKTFIKELEDFKIYISFDLGTPNYINELINNNGYLPLNEDIKIMARKVVGLLVPVFREYNNVSLVFNIWSDYNNINVGLSEGDYIINMIPEWQTKNAVYIDKSRFDANWKYWDRTFRVGELQRININMPRLAARSKNKEEFISQIVHIVKLASKMFVDSYKYVQLDMAQIILGEKRMRSVGLYTHNDDSLHTVTFCGMNEALTFLGINNYKTKKEILEKCNSELMSVTGMRVGLSGLSDSFVSNRFVYLNKNKNIRFADNYSENITSTLDEGRLHYLLTGGHKLEVNTKSFDINEMIKNKIGCIRLK